MAVDVGTFATTYGEDIRRARVEALMAFRDEVLAPHAEEREEILAALRELRGRFREAGREDLEDLVLDAMDIVTGWVSPQMRV